MSTIRRMIEGAAGRAHANPSADRNRFTVVLPAADAQAFGINRAIRLVLDPAQPAAVAHYTDAGLYEHQAGHWVPGDETGANTLDGIRADPALAALALVAADRRHREA